MSDAKLPKRLSTLGNSCAIDMLSVAHVVFCPPPAAGLSAARQLRNHGYKVVVVEGAKRAGGRVYGHRMEVSGASSNKKGKSSSSSAKQISGTPEYCCMHGRNYTSCAT